MLVPGVLVHGVLGVVGVLRWAENPSPKFDLHVCGLRGNESSSATTSFTSTTSSCWKVGATLSARNDLSSFSASTGILSKKSK